MFPKFTDREGRRFYLFATIWVGALLFVFLRMALPA
jgi:hypothetical protein